MCQQPRCGGLIKLGGWTTTCFTRRHTSWPRWWAWSTARFCKSCVPRRPQIQRLRRLSSNVVVMLCLTAIGGRCSGLCRARSQNDAPSNVCAGNTCAGYHAASARSTAHTSQVGSWSKSCRAHMPGHAAQQGYRAVWCSCPATNSHRHRGTITRKAF